MREVAIIGIGLTPIGEQWDKSLRQIAVEAVIAALKDAGRESVDGIFVGNMLSGILSHQENLGTLIADWMGLHGVEAFKIEAACASGAAAVRLGWMAIASGAMDAVIAMGVEKMADSKMADVTAALATAADADYEADEDISFVGINALIMRRYLYEYGWKHTDFAPFSINVHANAMHNPSARLHERITETDYNQATMIADPINLLDSSPTGDGAAALLLVPAETLRKNGQPIITIAGTASATDTIATHNRREATWLSAAAESARKAYAQAGVGPQDIDLFELHDAFSIMAALSLEACGFVEKGQGPRAGLEGEILPIGRIPIATRGGLKARGHPVGATGVYQIAEVVQQLRGEAGDNQVPGAKIGMAQNIGGSGSNIQTHIIKRIV
jgi:acetyl-CoA C-acetyltransferase